MLLDIDRLSLVFFFSIGQIDNKLSLFCSTIKSSCGSFLFCPIKEISSSLFLLITRYSFCMTGGGIIATCFLIFSLSFLTSSILIVCRFVLYVHPFGVLDYQFVAFFPYIILNDCALHHLNVFEGLFEVKQYYT